MNQSHEQFKEADEAQEAEEIHEGTLALQDIARQVEKERAERGRTEFDVRDEPEERAMSDAATFSEDHPDGGGESSEDHSPASHAVTGRAESAVQAVLRPVPGDALRPH